jgi:hypothetical protein
VIGPSAGGIAMDLWPGRGLPVLLSGAAALMLGGLAIRLVGQSGGITSRERPS